MSLGDDSQQSVPGSTPAEEPVPAPSPTDAPPPAGEPAPAPEPPVGGSGADGGSASPPPTPPIGGVSEGEPAPERETIVDAVADLLQMIVNYLRQETASLMRDKVVLPGQQLGMLVAFAFAAAALLVVGLCFIFVAILLVLADLMGWPAALALVGSLILIGAGVLTYLKVRSIQT